MISMAKVQGIIDNETIIIRMEQDEDAESPREWDNIGKMICWHSRYNLGDKHSYSEPRGFLEDLVSEMLDTELAQNILREKADKEFAQYELMQTLSGQFILVSKKIYSEKLTEDVPTLEEANQRVYELKAQLVSDEYADSPRHARYVAEVREGIDVMSEIRAKIEKQYSLTILQTETGFVIYDALKWVSELHGEEFESKEDALDRLEDAKEEWMEDEPETSFTFAELNEIIALEYVLLPLYLYDHSGITMKTSGFSCPWDSGQVGFIYASKDTFKKETGYLESELFSTDKNRTPVVGEGVKVSGYEGKSYDGFASVIAIEGNQVTIDLTANRTPSLRKEEDIITVSLEDITEVRSNRANEMLEGEVEVYDQFLRGDVYGFVVEKVKGCECCGNEETEHIDSCWGFFGDNPFTNGISDHVEKKYHELLKKLA